VQGCVYPMGKEEPTEDVAIVVKATWKYVSVGAEQRSATPALAESLANVAKVLAPSREGARRQLAEALLRLQKVPGRFI